jgi:KipI family sensor histidine kinase inhibitor
LISFGEEAVLFRRTGDLVDPLVLPRLGERLMDSGEFADVVATEVELMVVGAQGISTDQLKARAVSEIERQSAGMARDSQGQSRYFRLPVCFDTGADWNVVLEETGLARRDYIEHILKTRLVLTMYGFVPGFLYMRGLPETLRCARKAIPDHRAGEGSVAVGGPYFGIYGLETPAGWNVIGHTPLRTVKARELPPTPFRVGDEFRVEEISSDALADQRSNPPSLEELQIHA